MKNRLFLFCLLFLPFLSWAQESYRRQGGGFAGNNVQLGFTLSPNIGWMRVTNSGNSGITTGSRSGISYGVLGDFGFDKNYFFSTAFTVTSINGKLSQPLMADASNYSGIYKLQYIEIPLTLKLKSNATDLARFYGQFGLGTGIKISGKESNNNNSDNYRLSGANIFRASLIVGAGAEWNLNPGLNLQTGLTLNHGLTNTISSSYDIKSDYLALSLGIFF
jgi:hypothetical protein